MTSQDLHLLLLTDDSDVSERFERIVDPEAQLEICRDADSAFAHLENSQASIVILDTALDGARPWKIVERVRREFPTTDLVLLGSDEPGGDEADMREDWVLGLIPRVADDRSTRRALQRTVASRRQTLENRHLRDSLFVLERCRELSSCLDTGKVYPIALEIMLELHSRSRAISVFHRTSVPMSDAVVFRGLAEAEARRLRDYLVDEKPLSGHSGDRIEIVDNGPYLEILRDLGISVERMLVVPLAGERGEAGMIWILEDDRPFDQAEIQRAEIVRGYAVAALVNCERYQHAKERAFIDDVTEVYNARYLLATCENEIRRAERYHNSLSVLFLDLDRFKLVNDRYGHLVGSQTLRNLSQVLLQCVRDVDTLARYGGDEFTILLVDTDHQEACAIAERIRRTVEKQVFEAGRGGSLRVTLSLGVGTYPQHGSERNTLLDASDKAMYRAKSLGRNRVCSADELTF
jgi:two-component system cell cycle response regulator